MPNHGKTSQIIDSMGIHKLFNITVESDINLIDYKLRNVKNCDFSIKESDKSPLNKDFIRFHTIYSNKKPWLSYYKFNKLYGLRFHSFADFTLNGRNIQYYKRKKTNLHTLRHLINDQVIPLTLSLNNNIIFHASTIKIDNAAISFHAPSGYGKSTLAAYFLKKKHHLLTDDSLLLEYRKKKIYAYPSYPGVRLWSDSLEKIFSDNLNTVDVSQFNTKQLIDFKSNYLNNNQKALRLKSIYFIKEAKETYVEKPSKSEAFSMLIGNIFRLDFTNKKLNTQQFNFINKEFRKA